MTPPLSPPMLRLATPSDLPAINAIYNHYVLTSTATWQTLPETESARHQWFSCRNLALHPVVVAEENCIIAAWGSLSPFAKREAFDHTVENSLYVHPDFHRRGLGRLLLEDQISRATAAGHHTLISAISAEQTASLKLHFLYGFVETGRLRQAGYKLGQWLDLIYLQKMLQA